MKIISKIKSLFQKKKLPTVEKIKTTNDENFNVIDEIKNVFSNTDNIKKYSLIIFLVWIFYQLFKILINSNLASLEFFSYTNTINDFLYIIWFSFSITFLFLFIQMFILFLIELTYFKKLKTILKIIVPILLFLWFLSYSYAKHTNWNEFTIYLIFILLFIMYYYFITFNSYFKKKKDSYIIIIAYHILIFILLVFNPSYINACSKIDSNKCIELVYKNDKYGFWKDWHIYNIKDFKVFKTKKENIN